MEQQNQNQTTEVQTTEIVKGKTVASFNLPTPMWATWIFRTEFVLNKMAMMYLAATDRISTADVKEYLLIATILDFGVWAFARSIGVKKKDLGLPEEND